MSLLKQKIDMLKKVLEKEKKYILERGILLKNISFVHSVEEKNLVLSKIKEITEKIESLNSKLKEGLGDIHKRGSFSEVEIKKDKFFGTKGGKLFAKKDLRPDELEYLELKRIHKKEKEDKEEEDKKKKIKEKSEYSKIAYKTFSKMSRDLLGIKSFQVLERDLIKQI